MLKSTSFWHAVVFQRLHQISIHNPGWTEKLQPQPQIQSYQQGLFDLIPSSKMLKNKFYIALPIFC